MKNEKNDKWAEKKLQEIANEELAKREAAEQEVNALKLKLFVANVMISKLVVLTQMTLTPEQIKYNMNDIDNNHKNLTDAVFKNLYDGK